MFNKYQSGKFINIGILTAFRLFRFIGETENVETRSIEMSIFLDGFSKQINFT